MKQGFTLIELLVVVLIIGILTAIAIPQYETAVEKSRAAEAFSTGKTILDAMNRALAERPGELPNYPEALDVKVGGGTWNNNGVYTTNFFTYDISSGKTLKITRNMSGNDGYEIVMYNAYNPSKDGQRTCQSKGSTGQNLCKMFQALGYKNLSAR